MKMIKVLLFLFLAMTVQSFYAQTQQGYVKTLGRPEKKGEALSGVVVRVKGEHNPVVSNYDGTFTMLLANKKNGDAYSLQQVQKNGYELNENDMIGRPLAFSDKVPLTIVMVSSAQLQADKQRIENNAYKTAEKNFNDKFNLLEKQLADNKITIEKYREEIQILQERFEKYQSLIDGLAEHYAHTDYDLLEDTDREINICIENGDLERADSLIHTLFDPIDVLKRNKEALTQLDLQIGQAKNIIIQANEDMAAALKQQEKDGEYLYQLYTIAIAKFDNEKAQYYIETRAELDTANPGWQFDAGYYCQEQNDFIKSNKYYSRAIEIYRRFAKENPKIYEPDLASTLNNLAILYKNTQHITESEAMYLEALESYKRLAKNNPKEYKPYVARTLNNLALLYSNTQRFSESETMYLEALEIRRNLAQINPQAFDPDVAMTLNNLANLYKNTQRLAESEALQLEALQILYRLAKENPKTYDPYFAMTLNNLAVLYSDSKHSAESEVYHLRVLEIYKRLAKDDPKAYEPVLATTLDNLASLYFNTQRFEESETFYKEALDIYRRLAVNNHLAFDPIVALTLNNLAILSSSAQRLEESETLYLEALEIYRHLPKDVFQTHEPNVANTMNNLAELYFNTQRLAESESLYVEALEIYRHLAKDAPQAYEPDLVMTLNSLAILYYKAQRLSESETMYLESLEIYRRLATIDPQAYRIKMVTALYSLGLLYWQQKQCNQAIPVFEEVLTELKPIITTSPSYRKWYENSLDLLTQLYRMTEEHAKYLIINNERLPLMKQHYQDDVETYQKDYVRALGEQSFQCIFVGQLEESEQYAREAITIDSTQLQIQSHLAASLLFQGKYVEAEAIYGQYKDKLKEDFLQSFDDFESADVIPEERKADVERIKIMLNE